MFWPCAATRALSLQDGVETCLDELQGLQARGTLVAAILLLPFSTACASHGKQVVPLAHALLLISCRNSNVVVARMGAGKYYLRYE